jgi:DNA topoisomerase-3
MDQVRQLLAEGRTGKLDGFVSKAGRPFAAHLRLGQDGKVGFDFDGPPAGRVPFIPPRTVVTELAGGRPGEPEVSAGPLACPKCGIGHIIEGRRGFGCNRYREGCDFVVWKEVAGRLLDENQIRCLIATGCTGLIQGFNGGGGTRFDASLRLDDHWRVVLDFPVDEGDSNPGKLE